MTRLLAIVAGVLILSNLLWAVYAVGLLAQRDRARLERVELIAQVIGQREDAQRRARQQERANAQAMVELATQLNKDLSHANEKHAVVVADLRADTVRLRGHWQGCLATGDLSRAAQTAARADDGAELRTTGAGDLVRAGAECDARITAWQRYADTVTAELKP